MDKKNIVLVQCSLSGYEIFHCFLVNNMNHVFDTGKFTNSVDKSIQHKRFTVCAKAWNRIYKKIQCQVNL